MGPLMDHVVARTRFMDPLKDPLMDPSKDPLKDPLMDPLGHQLLTGGYDYNLVV